ncbi:MAG: guanylate kinase [Dethiobacteria bacterium]|nr:guanylate kinase [Bacillota bacterium]
MAEGILLIISGPSGVGKGTVCRRLIEIRGNLRLSVSTTTRPPRSSEEEGREYNFTDLPRFKEMIKEGAFLEWAQVHSHYYGTRLEVVREVLSGGEDLILEIDVQGAAQVRKNTPGAVSIFLAPPSLEALEERIRGRGTEDTLRIRQRLIAAREEMQAYHLYDYVVVNDTVEQAAGLVGSIIDAEKCRVSRGVRPPGWGGE